MSLGNLMMLGLWKGVGGGVTPKMKWNVVFTGARGVMVIVVGNGHSDMSSNPGQD